MKKVLLLTVLFAFIGMNFSNAYAAFVRNVPVVRIQPNGDSLHCFASGDEFYHWLHDADGFTIIQNHSTGWYVYAMRQWNNDNSNWKLVPTNLVPGIDSPSTAGLQPNLIESRQTVDSLHKQYDIPLEYRVPSPSMAAKNTNQGTINNVVIFIRFAGETEIATNFSYINSMFNDSTSESTSMFKYFWEASYHQLRLPTTFLPEPSGNTVISYQDSLPRERFMPYDAITNPTGYHDGSERADMEFGLLERAVNYIEQNYTLPTGLNIDYNNDGMVDNVVFVLKGTYTGWNDLLWPHKWSIYDREVYLAGKRVYTYNIQLEGSGSHYFSPSAFCHEMFHTLGAPDLYHYNNYTNVMNVGIWDLMCNNTTPPQHMNMYMKMRYGRWLDSVPEITQAGTYSLRSVGEPWNDSAESSTPRCYRIMAGNPNQWYYLEYRHNSDHFDQGLPGSGLIVYRINSRYRGNGNFDAQNTFDEVYIFHPGADNDTTPGSIAQAFFSLESGRTAFTPTTDPHPWLTNGQNDTTLYITNIGSAGDSITFTYTPHRPATPVFDSSACKLTITMTDENGDTWNGAYLDIETIPGSSAEESQHIASIAIGDCKTSETRTITVGNQPVRIFFNGGEYPDECDFSIRLDDGTDWSGIISVGSFHNIYNPCGGPLERHSILVQFDNSRGFANGSGMYHLGDIAHLRANARDHHSFKGWIDGPYTLGTPYTDSDFASISANRDITVTSDSIFTAIFEPDSFYVHLYINDSTMGTVEGDGLYKYSDTAILTATPNPGFDFDYWKIGSFTYTDNPLIVVVDNDKRFTAYFKHYDGIEEMYSNIAIYNQNHDIVINGAEGKNIEIFDMLGRKVAFQQAEATTTITMQHTGVYIVHIDGVPARKVVVM